MTREDWLHEEKEILTLLTYIEKTERRESRRELIAKSIKRRKMSNEAVYGYLPEGEL